MPASPPGINPATGADPAVAKDCGCLRAFLACARAFQSRYSQKSDAGAEKMRFVEKTSKNALTPKRAFAYKPPIETATPLATPSPPRFSGTLGLVADNLGSNACL